MEDLFLNVLGEKSDKLVNLEIRQNLDMIM